MLAALDSRDYNVEPCQMDETRMILPDDVLARIRKRGFLIERRSEYAVVSLALGTTGVDTARSTR
jgi:hypothetical protein